MAIIPKIVLDQQPPLQSLPIRSRGKVRDSYDLPGHPDKMLVVASDRCSIFDFVLATHIAGKGEILTALNYFWGKSVLGPICETDFVACGAAIDEYLPLTLRNNHELQKRATVVRLLPAPDLEDIVRMNLTGSGWESYQKTGTVCGHRLPAGLKNGSRLPYPIYTPTTKAEIGHNQPVSADSVVESHGFLRERLALQVAGALSSYAAERGIIMADTKFEFSGAVLADEKGTPDSSRFVDEGAWKRALAKGQLAPSLDKQYVREWGKKIGIDRRDPEKAGDVEFVHSQVVPDYVRDMTTRIYRYIFWRLTGSLIESFQHTSMGIPVAAPRRKVEILVGSENDLPQIEEGIKALRGNASFRVSVISCHRNPDELRRFAELELTKADIVIAGAGKAAALPGIIKSWLCAFNRSDIPVIGVAFKGQTERDDRATIASIEDLPGQIVELDKNNQAYFGAEGFLGACSAALQHEFLPRPMEQRSAQIAVQEQE